MRDYQRNEFERPRLNLVRGTDGRLRSTGSVPNPERRAVQKPVFTEQLAPRLEPRAPVYTAPSVRPERQSDELKTRVEDAPRSSKIRMPSLPLDRLRLLPKKYVVVAAAVFAVAILGATGLGVMAQRDDERVERPAPTSSDIRDTKGPEFQALLPSGKQIKDLGGWARVSPANQEPVYAYVDALNGIQLNISQQKLPSNLQSNTAEGIAKLAEGFAATEKIVSGDVTAYLGTSIKGPQSLIFAKKDLLILIKSSGKLSNQEWAAYVASLL